METLQRYEYRIQLQWKPYALAWSTRQGTKLRFATASYIPTFFNKACSRTRKNMVTSNTDYIPDILDVLLIIN